MVSVGEGGSDRASGAIESGLRRGLRGRKSVVAERRAQLELRRWPGSRHPTRSARSAQQPKAAPQGTNLLAPAASRASIARARSFSRRRSRGTAERGQRCTTRSFELGALRLHDAAVPDGRGERYRAFRLSTARGARPARADAMISRTARPGARLPAGRLAAPAYAVLRESQRGRESGLGSPLAKRKGRPGSPRQPLLDLRPGQVPRASPRRSRRTARDRLRHRRLRRKRLHAALRGCVTGAAALTKRCNDARRSDALLAPVRGDEHDAPLLFRHDNAERDRVVSTMRRRCRARGRPPQSL